MSLKFGIVGFPVDHSLSPAMHGAAYRALEMDATYERLSVAPADLADRIASLAKDGFSGVNVTIPHKETVLSLLDSVEPVATAIGAVNTIAIEHGKLIGTNTDAAGSVRALAEADVVLAGTRAVVLGAGGAARAVVYGLLEAGASHVTILARDPRESRRVAESLVASAKNTELAHGSLEQSAVAAFEQAGLLLQTTSATMERSGDAIVFAMSLPFDALPETAVVCDIVYRPRETTVMKAATNRGLRTIDGLGMLLHQAGLSFERWTGKPAPLGAMKNALEAAI